MQQLRLEVDPAELSAVRWEDPWTVVWEQGGQRVVLYLLRQEGHTLWLQVNGKRVQVEWQLPVHRYLERVQLPRARSAAQLELRSPMPGLIREVRVQLGQAVSPRTPALVLEAMKMENLLFAPAEGIVETIAVTPGQAVEKGALLIRLRARDAD